MQGRNRHSPAEPLTLAGLRLFKKAASMLKPQILCAALIAATVTGCDKPAPPTSQARPVRRVAVERPADVFLFFAIVP
jgi:hypothetical protein